MDAADGAEGSWLSCLSEHLSPTFSRQRLLIYTVGVENSRILLKERVIGRRWNERKEMRGTRDARELYNTTQYKCADLIHNLKEHRPECTAWITVVEGPEVDSLSIKGQRSCTFPEQEAGALQYHRPTVRLRRQNTIVLAGGFSSEGLVFESER